MLDLVDGEEARSALFVGKRTAVTARWLWSRGKSRFLRSFLLVLAAVVLAGCIRFQPKPLSPAETAEQLKSRTLANPALRTFLSANLHRELTDWPAVTWDFDMLTMAAFYYHPSLEVARADWRVALGGQKTAAERPNPTVTASGIYEPAADAFNPWIPGLMFELPIETAGKRRVRTEQARHLSEAARLNLAAMAWQVRSQLRASLLEFVAAEQRVALLQDQVALREDFANRLQTQLQAGAISALELNTARLALLRARADMADARRLLAEARPHLASSLGLPAAALEHVNFHFDLTSIPGAEELTKDQVRDLALRGRADILGLLAEYAASQSGLQLELAKQYPDIRLTPGYSWNAGSTGEHDWQLGATVELPLLNRHRGPIAEAAARREASAARFLALQAKVLNEVDAAVASFRASQTNAVVLESLLTSQAAQRQRIEQQFQAGAADRLDVLAASLELNAASLTQFEARVKLQQAAGALEDAIQRPFELPAAIFEIGRTAGSE
jgi:outer membrane protein, heavy metal efflux system